MASEDEARLESGAALDGFLNVRFVHQGVQRLCPIAAPRA
jgi:hypothetical protein